MCASAEDSCNLGCIELECICVCVKMYAVVNSDSAVYINQPPLKIGGSGFFGVSTGMDLYLDLR